MHDFLTEPITTEATSRATADLFMWRGRGIVLLGTLDSGRWVLARGWLEGDRLEHIRRWSFAQPIPFSGQVRRLITDATRDTALACLESQRALAWTESMS